MSVDDWMIIDKKVSKPELAVEAITAESDASAAAEPAVKMLNFEVCVVGKYIVLKLCILFRQ